MKLQATRIGRHLTAALLVAAGLGAAPAYADDCHDPDARIAADLRALNNGEIDQARLALARAVDPATRAYAQRMLDEHTAANLQLAAHLERLGIAPCPNIVTGQLTGGSAAAVALLRELPPGDFDVSYMKLQIGAHAQALGALDYAWRPEARSPAMREFLQAIRAAVADHLRDARPILARLLEWYFGR